MTNVIPFPGERITFDARRADVVRHKFASLAVRSVYAELIKATPDNGVLELASVEALSQSAGCSRAATFEALKVISALGVVTRSGRQNMSFRWDESRVRELAAEVEASDVALTIRVSAGLFGGNLAVDNAASEALEALWWQAWRERWARKFSPHVPPRREVMPRGGPSPAQWGRMCAWSTGRAEDLAARVERVIDRAVVEFFRVNETKDANLKPARYPLQFLEPLLHVIDPQVVEALRPRSRVAEREPRHDAPPPPRIELPAHVYEYTKQLAGGVS